MRSPGRTRPRHKVVHKIELGTVHTFLAANYVAVLSPVTLPLHKLLCTHLGSLSIVLVAV